MSLDFTDDKLTLVQVMAWCRQATNHYLDQCWLSSMLPYGITGPQWVSKNNFDNWYMCHITDLGQYWMGYGLLSRDTKLLPEPMLTIIRSFAWWPRASKMPVRHVDLGKVFFYFIYIYTCTFWRMQKFESQAWEKFWYVEPCNMSAMRLPTE